MKLILSILPVFVLYSAFAQTDRRLSPNPVNGIATEAYRNYLEGLKAHSIGPTIMSGRIVDLEVDPSDPTHFYVAYATGGLWETNNNGTTFESIFNDQPVFGLGDIAVDWKSKKIFVG